MTWRPEPPKSELDFWTVAVGALLLALLMGAYVGCAEVIHGDWRCAFAQCRIETR